MEKLFETLAEIEQKANRIINNAHSYQSILEQEKTQKLKTMEQEFQNQLEEKTSALQTKTTQDISKRKAKLQLETQKQLKALNSLKEEDLTRLADQIVADILEGAVL